MQQMQHSPELGIYIYLLHTCTLSDIKMIIKIKSVFSLAMTLLCEMFQRRWYLEIESGVRSDNGGNCCVDYSLCAESCWVGWLVYIRSTGNQMRSLCLRFNREFHS